MKVHKIAHCRSGDKGDFSLVSVIVYDMKDYQRILKHLTVDKVKKQYGDRVQGRIVRHEMPKIGACIFEMEHALGGGVVRTLRHDGHGKNVSYAMMEIELAED